VQANGLVTVAPRHQCVHRAHNCGYQTWWASGDMRADQGSSTCGCKAQHEDRPTSNGVYAVVRSKRTEKGMVTTDMDWFYPHSITADNQSGEAMACSYDTPGCGGGRRQRSRAEVQFGVAVQRIRLPSVGILDMGGSVFAADNSSLGQLHLHGACGTTERQLCPRCGVVAQLLERHPPTDSGLQDAATSGFTCPAFPPPPTPPALLLCKGGEFGDKSTATAQRG
jgi:hypothetical protein